MEVKQGMMLVKSAGSGAWSFSAHWWGWWLNINLHSVLNKEKTFSCFLDFRFFMCEEKIWIKGPTIYSILRIYSQLLHSVNKYWVLISLGIWLTLLVCWGYGINVLWSSSLGVREKIYHIKCNEKTVYYSAMGSKDVFMSEESWRRRTPWVTR